MNQKLWEQLCGIVGSDHIFTDEPMKKHTTFRIGGPADYFVQPHSRTEMAEVLKVCREASVPCFILGNGSNLLVGDLGFRGVVMQVFKNYCDIIREGDRLRVQAGALLSKVAKKALEYGLTGFEFAAGIPGTMGGAVCMNAGAYGGEMKDVLLSAAVLTKELTVKTVGREELDLGYRTSSIVKNGWIVLETVLQLSPGDPKKIAGRMEELKGQRVAKQPLEYPSAGSAFKRPQGYFAGKLIMDSGLCGFQVGDAQISEKHCGFIINRGNATAKDVTELMAQVQERVYEKFRVRLEPEIKRLGEFL